MREKLRRFMQGRYGADQLSRFLTAIGLVLIVIFPQISLCLIR